MSSASATPRSALLALIASMLLCSIWGTSSASAATEGSTPGFGLPHFGGLTVSSTGLMVKLSCTGSTAQTCSGAIVVSTTETLHGKKIASVSTAKHRPKRHEVAVRVAQAPFSLAGGASATIQVKLNSNGVKLLRRFHTMSALVFATETIPHGQFFFLARDVQFKAPKQKHKKHH